MVNKFAVPGGIGFKPAGNVNVLPAIIRRVKNQMIAVSFERPGLTAIKAAVTNPGE